MNYYEHHIGDYAEATAHLSFVEDAAYSRLIRKYYATERPIPADLKAAQRLIAARTREEREAVQRVLEEFFQRSDDGWRHPRCDREIAAYLAGQPQREAKKRNEDVRLERHRAARSALFQVINDAGQHMPWNTPMAELRAAAERIRSATPATPPATHEAEPATDSATPPATAPATPATATHTRAPLPTSHFPPPTTHPPTNIDTRSAQPQEAPADEQPDQRVTMAGAVCVALKAAGIGRVNPGHARLTALLEAGAGVDAFIGAAAGALRPGVNDPFAYVLGVVEGQMTEARHIAANGHAKAANGTNGHGHSGSKARAARMAEAVPNLVASGHDNDDFIDTETRDVTPRRLG